MIAGVHADHVVISHLHIFIVYFVSNSTGHDTNLKLEIFIHRP